MGPAGELTRPSLSRLTLRGYKTIRELNPFEPGIITVLIGPNGAGKNNFISFFRMLSWTLAPPGNLQTYVAEKKNLRLVEVVPMEQKWVLKNVSGGVLLQDNDVRPLNEADLKVVSERKPTEQEMRDLLFAWKVCKHVKSNAILYARNGQTTGVGAGQMSRVDSAKIGAMKSVLGIKGSVAASDAFFPFPDGVEEIAKAGATAIIQPGGSVRDKEVIDAANRLGLAMVLTGVRHFRH